MIRSVESLPYKNHNHWLMLKRVRGKSFFYSILIITGSLIHLSASAQFTKYSNEFLNIGAGARGMSMAGAQAASVSDGTAGYWNPAALANIRDKPQLNLKDNKRTIGLTLLRFAVDDIPNTIFLVQPDGTVNFDNITTFSSADYAFIFSLAQKAKLSGDKEINFGVNAKVIH